jgi:peptidoglycan hydrolase CwlO-like protein
MGKPNYDRILKAHGKLPKSAEGKVDNYETLKQANGLLERKVQELEAENSELKDQILALTQDKPVFEEVIDDLESEEKKE